MNELGYASASRTENVTTIEITPALGLASFGVQTRIADQAGNESTTSRDTITIVLPNNDPMANDDTFTIEKDSANFILDVLRNDTTAPDENEFATITQASAPNGSGTVVIGFDGLSLQYSPPSGFTGTKTLSYTISDGNGGDDVAAVTVNVVSPVVDVVSVSVRLSDLSGSPITAISLGQKFALDVLIEDQSENATGVFAAFVDLFYRR